VGAVPIAVLGRPAAGAVDPGDRVEVWVSQVDAGVDHRDVGAAGLAHRAVDGRADTPYSRRDVVAREDRHERRGLHRQIRNHLRDARVLADVRDVGRVQPGCESAQRCAERLGRLDGLVGGDVRCRRAPAAAEVVL
jgi:hypothetical protein